eukprot:Gb_22589 [translate_table: standard]
MEIVYETISDTVVKVWRIQAPILLKDVKNTSAMRVSNLMLTLYKEPYTSFTYHLAVDRAEHICQYIEEMRNRWIGMAYQPDPLIMPFSFNRNIKSRGEKRLNWRGFPSPMLG